MSEKGVVMMDRGPEIAAGQTSVKASDVVARRITGSVALAGPIPETKYEKTENIRQKTNKKRKTSR